jgi:hypothetical protein
MKKFAVSLFALAAISGAAFASNGADNNVPAFDHTPGAKMSVYSNSVDGHALAVSGQDKISEIPNYINRSQLR